jgi:hypothetical protein
MLVPVRREIVALEWIVLQIEQLDVVQFEERNERR